MPLFCVPAWLSFPLAAVRLRFFHFPVDHSRYYTDDQDDSNYRAYDRYHPTLTLFILII